ncbi:FG-GAP repeat protein [Vibrio vulnificus]|nr:FG-GAP repeat protein [Vibrio vulnificus]
MFKKAPVISLVSLMILGCSDPSRTPNPQEQLELKITSVNPKQIEFSWDLTDSTGYTLCLDESGSCNPVVFVGDAPDKGIIARIPFISLAFADEITPQLPLESATTPDGKVKYSHYIGSLLDADQDIFYIQTNGSEKNKSEEVVIKYKEFTDAIGKFKPDTPIEWQNHGHSVAFSGDGRTKVITSLKSTSSNLSGDVSVYERSNEGVWSKVASLESDPSNNGLVTGFGIDVDVDDHGNTIAIGSWKDEVSGKEEAGSVYVFTKKPDGTWGKAYKITNPEPSIKDFFGSSISISGDGKIIAISAYNEDSDGNSVQKSPLTDDLKANSGAVYIYSLDGGSWVLQSFIKAPNSDKNDFFGRKVKLSKNGQVLVSTANGEDSFDGNMSDNSVFSVGAAYIYRSTGSGDWVFEKYLKSTLPIGQSGFGQSLDISYRGDIIALGVSKEADTASTSNADIIKKGAVHLWNYDGLGWVHQARLTASNGEDGDDFGTSVAIGAYGRWLAVGAQYEDSGFGGIDADQGDNSSMNSGAAYIFEFNGYWEQTHYIKSLNPTEKSYFGKSIAFSPIAKELSISAPSELVDVGDGSEVNAGVTYLF